MIEYVKEAIRCHKEFIAAMIATSDKYPELHEQCAELIEFERKLLTQATQELLHELSSQKV